MIINTYSQIMTDHFFENWNKKKKRQNTNYRQLFICFYELD